MKKIWIIIILVSFCFLFVACQEENICELNAPNIKVNNDLLVIDNVQNATNFIIFIDGDEKEKIDKTFYDLSTLSIGVHSIYVIAVDDTKHYSNSPKSNNVTYEKKNDNSDTKYNVSNSIYQDQYNINAPLKQGSWNFSNQIGEILNLVSSEQIKNSKIFKILADQLASNVDDQTLSWKGEFWGKMVWGGANIYKYTQDTEVYDVLKETVSYVMSLQDENGRITSYSIDCEFQGWDIVVRKNVMNGMLYFYDICKEDEFKNKIIDCLNKQANYIISNIGEGKKRIVDTSSEVNAINSSSILECFVRLFNLTGNEEYLDFARHILKCGGTKTGNLIEDYLSYDIMPYQSSVQMIDYMIEFANGLLTYYETTKEEKYKEAAINFYEKVRRTDVTLIGCLGTDGEMINNSTVEQSNLEMIGTMQATCVSAYWLSFLNRLLLIYGNGSVVDEAEKTIYNALLGAIDTTGAYRKRDGEWFMIDSFSPMTYGIRASGLAGGQMVNDIIYGCCVVTGTIGVGMIPSLSYSKYDKGIRNNLYYSGEVHTTTPTGNNISVNTVTSYPKDGDISLSISLEKEEKMCIALRIPSWSKQTKVLINSQPQEVNIKDGYFEIDRLWKNGDQIELQLDMTTYLIHGSSQSLNQNAVNSVAIIRGPLAFAREIRLESEGFYDSKKIINNNGVVTATVVENSLFDNMCTLEVDLCDGNKLKVVDYASAGKTYDKNSTFALWFPEIDYYSVDFNKSVMIYSQGTSSILNIDKGNLISNGYIYDFSNYNPFSFGLEKIEGNYYRLRYLETSQYVTVGKDGLSLTAREDSGKSNQIFYIENVGINRYKIISKFNNLLLSLDDNYKPFLYPDANSLLQIWRFTQTNVEYVPNIFKEYHVDLSKDVYVYNVATNKSVIIKDGYLQKGVVVDQIKDYTEYLWKLHKVENTDFYLIELSNGKYLYSTSGNNKIYCKDYDSDHKEDFYFILEEIETNKYNIWNYSAGRYLLTDDSLSNDYVFYAELFNNSQTFVIENTDASID